MNTVPVSKAGFIQLIVLVQLMFLHQTRLVRCCDTSHGHVGAVDDKDKDGNETDHCTHHAETDDASTAQVQSLHDVAAQEGATTSCWYHHVSCEVEENSMNTPAHDRMSLLTPR